MPDLTLDEFYDEAFPNDPYMAAEMHREVDRMRAERKTAGTLRISRDLLDSLVEDSQCRFDHHGGCQEHGYLSLYPGEMCPQAEAKRLLGGIPTVRP